MASMETRPCFSSTVRRRSKRSWSASSRRLRGSKKPRGAWAPISFSNLEGFLSGGVGDFTLEAVEGDEGRGGARIDVITGVNFERNSSNLSSWWRSVGNSLIGVS